MLNAIIAVSNIEHDFPQIIEMSKLTNSYVVSMNFTKGVIKANEVYIYENNNLKKYVPKEENNKTK